MGTSTWPKPGTLEWPLTVYGSQDSAFAAALPLGLVLPKHIKIPAELREKL